MDKLKPTNTKTKLRERDKNIGCLWFLGFRIQIEKKTEAYLMCMYKNFT